MKFHHSLILLCAMGSSALASAASTEGIPAFPRVACYYGPAGQNDILPFMVISQTIDGKGRVVIFKDYNYGPGIKQIPWVFEENVQITEDEKTGAFNVKYVVNDIPYYTGAPQANELTTSTKHTDTEVPSTYTYQVWGKTKTTKVLCVTFGWD